MGGENSSLVRDEGSDTLQDVKNRKEDKKDSHTKSSGHSAELTEDDCPEKAVQIP